MPFAPDPSDNLENEIRERASVYNQILEHLRRSALDKTFDSHGGRPVEEVKAALVRQWPSGTGEEELAEPQLSAYAEAISAGRRPEIEATT